MPTTAVTPPADRAAAPAADDRRGRSPRHSRRVQGLLIGGLVFVVQSLSPTPQIGDSRLSAVTSWQFLHHLNLHLEGYPSVRTLTNRYDLVSHGGHILPFFPWPTMLFLAPADLIYSMTGRNPSALSVASTGGRTWILEIPTASLLVAVTAVLIWLIVLDLHGRRGRPVVAAASALTFAFCTSAWSIGSRALWQQTVSMLFLTAIVFTLMRLDRGRAWPWALGVLSALAFQVRPTNAIVVVLVVVFVALKRRSALVPLLVGAALATIPFVIVSVTEYGALLPPYYRAGRLGAPAPFSFPNALVENLISPSRGLVLYDPVVVLAAIGVGMRVRARRFGEIEGLMVVFVIGLWIVVATYGSTGGATYGPRQLMDAVPFVVLLSVPALSFLLTRRRPQPARGRRALAVGIGFLVGWGLFINATGGILRSSVCWSGSPVAVDSRPGRVWDWSDAQFLRPYRDMAAGDSLKEELVGTCKAIDTPADLRGG